MRSLDLDLPSGVWGTLAQGHQARLSTISAEDQHVSSPLETITALDALATSQRPQSAGSNAEFSGRSHNAPVRTFLSSQTEKKEFPPFSNSSTTLSQLRSEDATGTRDDAPIPGPQSRSSWLPAEEIREPQPVYPTGFRLLIMILALVFSIFLIALDMVSSAEGLPSSRGARG